MTDTWWRRAACRGADLSTFFPTKSTPYTRRKALTYCRRCPVLSQCRTDADSMHIQFGIWGGATAHERKTGEIHDDSKPKYPNGHGDKGGTVTGYWREYAAGIQVCDECRRAYNARNVTLRREKARNAATP